MKKKDIIILSVCVIIIILSLGVCLGIKYYTNKDLERLNKETEKIKESITYAEEENVNTFIEKFNTEILKNGIDYPLRDNYLDKNNNTYYYAVYQDIGFWTKPVSYTGNLEDDIIKDSSIYFPINTQYEEMAINFVKYLIKVNNPTLTYNKIMELIEEAKKLSNENQNVDGGNGILIRYSESSNNKYYIVTRRYKNSETMK